MGVGRAGPAQTSGDARVGNQPMTKQDGFATRFRRRDGLTLSETGLRDPGNHPPILPIEPRYECCGNAS